jgi:hypothetical protein
MFVAVVLIVLLILLLAVLASAIPSKPSARRALPRADDYAPARRSAPPANVTAQLPPAAQPLPVRVPTAREATPVSVPTPSPAPAAAPATGAPAATDAEPEFFTPADRFESRNMNGGRGGAFASTDFAEDGGGLGDFFVHVDDKDFGRGITNDDLDAIDWLTGQPVSVCQCGDCRARRARNGG